MSTPQRHGQDGGRGMTGVPLAVVGRRGLLLARADGTEAVVDLVDGETYPALRVLDWRVSAAGVVRGTVCCTWCGIATVLPVEHEPLLLPCGCSHAWLVPPDAPAARRWAR